MKREFVFLFVVLAAAVRCDSVPTRVWWKGWEIQTSEDRYWGAIHKGYPLTYLVDGDPKTAWVFSGLPKSRFPEFDGVRLEQWHGRYGVAFEPENPTVIDGVRIMNGYNKSREAFEQNDRVTDLEIWECVKPRTWQERMVKRVRLSDKMGFHTVSLPRKTYTRLVLVFKGFAAGTRYRDLCISEVQLMRGGRKIDFKVPKAVLATPGSDCGCFADCDVMTRGGRVLAHGEISEGDGYDVSFDWRYVAGVDSRVEKRPTFWICDLAKGRVVVRSRLARPVHSVGWVAERKVEVGEGKHASTFRVPRG